MWKSGLLILFGGLLVIGTPAAGDRAPREWVVQKAAMYDREFTRVPKTDPNYAPVGLVTNTKLEPPGTGFLISSCHVLTNYHVLYDDRPPDDRRFNFNIGYHQRADFKEAVAATPVALGNFSSTSYTCDDFAVLELRKCLPGYGYVNTGPLTIDQVLALQAPPYNKRVSSASFPERNDFSTVSVDPDCIVNGMHPLDSDAFGHTCDAEGRSSGGFLAFELRGKPVAFAIISEVMTTTDGRIGMGTLLEGEDAADPRLNNKAVPISCIYDRIKDFLGPK